MNINERAKTVQNNLFIILFKIALILCRKNILDNTNKTAMRILQVYPRIISGFVLKLVGKPNSINFDG